MRFLADENCDRPIVIALREAGHDVSYVAEWAGGLDDDSIFSAAYEQRRILVTCDHDFGLMAERMTERPPAIMLIRLEQLSPAGWIAVVLDTLLTGWRRHTGTCRDCRARSGEKPGLQSRFLMTDIQIRPARFPEDKPQALRFLMGLQRYEHDFEPNRRVDAKVADEYFSVLMERAGEHGGIFIAEDDSANALGWAVIYPDQSEVYVIPEEREFGRLTELYVKDDVRGRGVGRALIGACEDWARERGYKHILIGALAQNDLALGAYQAVGFKPYANLLRKYL